VAHQRYYPETGQAVYEKNRANCKRQLRIGQVTKFLNWAENKMRDESWSPDVVVGYAQLHRLFKREEMVCAKTLYSYIDRNLLKIRNIDLPLKTRRKPKRSRPPAKRTRGRSIDERPPSAEDRTEFGHWEIDTVQGKNQATWLC
jgi:IS30 family transposase